LLIMCRKHLEAVCQIDPKVITSDEKLSLFIETRQKFGRTALVFSGDVALGTFHSSVIRTLVERRLFPSVVVGANMGAVVAAFATTRTILELQLLFDDPAPPKSFYEKLTTVYVAAHRLRFQEASPYEIEKLQQSMRDLLGDLTFEEAYELSGRVLGISVPACVGRNQPAQFLNYLTSPHVVIWSAAALSCAPPLGLLSTPELMIKDRNGNIKPYVPPAKVSHPPYLNVLIPEMLIVSASAILLYIVRTEKNWSCEYR
jgi:TAG lipase/steryl ester hydrolase/phospholipase A2/LPA acyltransferase